MEVRATISRDELKQIQFIVKTLQLNSFRILETFECFSNVQVRYEMNVDEHNRLYSFLRQDEPKPLSKLTRFLRIFRRTKNRLTRTA